MTFRTTNQLRDVLLKLQLVEAATIENCIAEAGGPNSDPDALLKVLEQKHLLTPYQFGRLSNRETDGLVLGEFKLEYRNAAGSFARVFRASSIKDGRTVALKVLRNRWAKDDESVEQFHREAELCKRLRHKNIVPIYEIGKDADYHYFTMEFVEGGNLRDFINIRKKLSPVEATQVVLDVTEGLEYALQIGMTHRDMKMTNVLMGSDGVSKLVDFGLAGNEAPAGEDETVQTAIEYATIEKGSGAPKNDPRSDLFFVGTIFYELVSGIPAYERTASREKRKMFSRYTNIRPLHSVAPDAPQSVARVVEKLLRINPHERYQSATELIRELRGLLNELKPGDEPDELDDDADEPEEEENSEAKTPATVLCVENRTKHQDILRENLTKHGFRALVLSDVERALTRIQNDPPQCVVLMGEAIENDQELPDIYDRAVAYGDASNVAVILVLGEKQSKLKSLLKSSKIARVVQLPLKMAQLRHHIRRTLKYAKRRN